MEQSNFQLTQFKIYSALMKAAKCNPVQAAACLLLDKGLTFKEAASYLAVSAKVCENIYKNKAEFFAAEKSKFEASLSEVAAEIRSQNTNEVAAREAELKHPEMRKLKQFTYVCLNHFGAARKSWPTLSFNQYSMLRALSFFKKINRTTLSIISGISTLQIDVFIEELSALGAIAKLHENYEVYIAKDGNMYNTKVYDIEVHNFFRNTEFREV